MTQYVFPAASIMLCFEASQRYRTITSKKKIEGESLHEPLRTPKTPQYSILTKEAQHKPYWFKNLSIK
jgi:hypothetical protein